MEKIVLCLITVPCLLTYTNGKVDTESVYVGVMAQDLLDMKISEVVSRSPTSGYYSVDYSKIDVDTFTRSWYDWDRHQKPKKV